MDLMTPRSLTPADYLTSPTTISCHVGLAARSYDRRRALGIKIVDAQRSALVHGHACRIPRVRSIDLLNL